MIFIAPVHNGRLDVARGLFISTEMVKAFSQMTFSERFCPAHIPFEGLIRLDYGPDDHMSVSRKTWDDHGLPPLYDGSDLSGKKLVVFPMHALGDQLYLTTALHGLIHRYPGLEITVVRCGIPSVEKWYPFIYFHPQIQLREPVLSVSFMSSFDYYVDAEHFAHLDDFKKSPTVDFFLRQMFHHNPLDIKEKRPSISPVSIGDSTNATVIEKAFRPLLQRGYPIIFVNLVSTGRSRDLSNQSVLDFANQALESYSLVFSTYNNPEFEQTIQSSGLPHIICSGTLEKDISDLIDILLRVDGVITTDSGITHLSEALGKPCGTVFNVALPEERTRYYEYSESLNVKFEIQGICKTPCYVFALDKDELCPGMKFANQYSEKKYFSYPPCMENLSGDHLRQLLDALVKAFGI